MRIRSIKPEFWTSTAISRLTIEDRLLFIGLWSYVDDNGVGVDRLALIATDLFPDDIERDAQETFARVSRGLANLSAAGRITRYRVENADFLAITNWDEHQRIDKPGKPRYPLPTTGNAEVRESVATDPRESRETPATGTGEQGNRGTGEQPSSSANADASEDGRDDVDGLCQHLAERIVGNGNKPPTVSQAWKRAARLMLDRDHRPLDEAHRLIDWCQDDPFWMPNILSMPKFREKYDQLRLRAGAAVVDQDPVSVERREPDPEREQRAREEHEARQREAEAEAEERRRRSANRRLNPEVERVLALAKENR